MAERSYDGPPIDGSGQNIFDTDLDEQAESVEYATAPEEPGTEQSVLWPEAATPRDELNDNQIKIIETAAQNTQAFDSLAEVDRAAGVDSPGSYASYTLGKHWPEGKEEISKGNNRNRRDISLEDIDQIRRRLLDGATQTEVAAEFDITRSSVSDYARGRMDWIDESEIDTPQIIYNRDQESYEPITEKETSQNDRIEELESVEYAASNSPEPTGGGKSCKIWPLIAALVAVIVAWLFGGED